MAELNTLRAAALIAAIGAGTAAQSQDFQHDWEGFYAGAHLDGTAYSIGVVDLNNSFLAQPPDFTTLLFQGGVTGGYNYQLENNLLISAELDWSSVLEISEFVSSNANETTGVQYDLNMENVLQLRGRAGFTQGNALGYITAGVAQAQTSFETFAVNTGSNQVDCESSTCASNTEPLLGLTFGAGVDWAFRENWVGRIEFQHMAFENIEAPVRDSDDEPLCNTVDTGQCAVSYSPSSTSIRVGVSYMFE